MPAKGDFRSNVKPEDELILAHPKLGEVPARVIAEDIGCKERRVSLIMRRNDIPSYMKNKFAEYKANKVERSIDPNGVSSLMYRWER